MERYIPLYRNFRGHPKVQAAAEILGEREITVAGAFTYLLIWCLDHATDGDLRGYSDRALKTALGVDGDSKDWLEALARCGRGLPGKAGLLEKTREGYVIHDFEEHTEGLQEILAKDETAKAAKREQARLRKERQRQRERGEPQPEGPVTRDSHAESRVTECDGHAPVTPCTNRDSGRDRNKGGRAQARENPPPPDPRADAILSDLETTYAARAGIPPEYPQIWDRRDVLDRIEAWMSRGGWTEDLAEALRVSLEVYLYSHRDGGYSLRGEGVADASMVDWIKPASKPGGISHWLSRLKAVEGNPDFRRKS